ncbi:hypothetical protein AAFN86_03230 [Roseomonas sp. CAU 1739]|uniref:hypothetical protein n=1 Tax=Roseomonas sp. CAU 1739 TaxID=3140364 RepID=UPI00325B3FB5
MNRIARRRFGAPFLCAIAASLTVGACASSPGASLLSTLRSLSRESILEGQTVIERHLAVELRQSTRNPQFYTAEIDRPDFVGRIEYEVGRSRIDGSRSARLEIFISQPCVKIQEVDNLFGNRFIRTNDGIPKSFESNYNEIWYALAERPARMIYFGFLGYSCLQAVMIIDGDPEADRMLGVYRQRINSR